MHLRKAMMYIQGSLCRRAHLTLTRPPCGRPGLRGPGTPGAPGPHGGVGGGPRGKAPRRDGGPFEAQGTLYMYICMYICIYRRPPAPRPYTLTF